MKLFILFLIPCMVCAENLRNVTLAATKSIDSAEPFTNLDCESNRDCYPNGFCGTDNYCQCNICFLDNPESDQLCGIKLIPLIAPFLISFFLGGCGIDHCFFSGCSGCGAMTGIAKALTAGGFTIWWICDIVFIGTGSFSDRYHYDELCEHWVT